jgi:hypothetical protein
LFICTDLKQGKNYMMQRTVGAKLCNTKTPAVTCSAICQIDTK